MQDPGHISLQNGRSFFGFMSPFVGSETEFEIPEMGIPRLTNHDDTSLVVHLWNGCF